MKKIQILFLPALFSLAISGALHAGMEEGNQALIRGEHAVAFKEFQDASNSGDDRAFGKLGGMYLYGMGTEKDYSQAYIWFGLAAITGDKYAEKFQRAASSVMTREEVEMAEKELSSLAARLDVQPPPQK
jgi:TPR repeat protein